MAKRFDTIIESYMRTYQNNSLVVGDRVKFIDNYAAHNWFKSQPALKIERMRELIESGLNIRISAVKTSKPQTAESGHFEIVDAIHYDIVREEAPGMYSQVFTVPDNLVILQDDYPNIAGETPDSHIRHDTSNIKPEGGEMKDTAGQDFAPVGNPDAKDLPRSNVDISVIDPAKSYTGKYLQG